MTWPKGIPNPGSDAAIKKGCICAVFDNCHGQGAFDFPPNEKGEPVFWITGGCPLHAPKKAEEEVKL